MLRFDGVNYSPDDLVREKVLSSDLDDAGLPPPTSGSQGLTPSQHRWWTSGQLRTRGAPAARSSLATGSYLREASRLAQRNFDCLCTPSGVGQGLGNVLGFKVRILAENLIARSASGDQADNGSDRDPHAADARLSTYHARATSDTRQLRQVERLQVGRASIVKQTRYSAKRQRAVMKSRAATCL